MSILPLHRDSFDAQGNFAFSYTAIDQLRERIEPTPALKVLRYCVELAGLFHDFGKQNQFFQKKLGSAKLIKDPVRHELISVTAMEKLFLEMGFWVWGGKPLSSQGSSDFSDKDWLLKMSDQSFFSESIEAAFKDRMLATESRRASLRDTSLASTLFSGGSAKRHPLLSAILWLVLTHHRLPFGSSREEDRSIRLSFANHCNIDDAKRSVDDSGKGYAQKEINSVFELGKKNNFFWSDGAWIKAVSRCCERLLNCITEYFPTNNLPDNVSFDDWVCAFAYHGKVPLMLADHLVSSAKSASPSRCTKTIYANSVRLPSGKISPAQTLSEHLLSVGKVSSRNVRVLGGNFSWLPFVPDERLPVILKKNPGADRSSQFYWQDDAVERIDRYGAKNSLDGGFFGIVSGGTGSGKTVAGPKIMSALSKNGLRVTVCLGLRKLTYQSYDAYIKENSGSIIGFDRSDVALVAGSPMAYRMYESDASRNDASLLGSESSGDLGSEEVFFGNDEKDFGSDLFPDLQDKQRRLLSSPVVITTVDHMIGPAVSTRTNHVLPSVRLLTSDLILDEVDSYSEDDLVPLGKLVYYAGLSGRKVLLVSATLPPAIAKSFYASYSRGYLTYSRLHEKPDRIACGWFSDCSDISIVKTVSDADRFGRYHDSFVENTVSRLKSEVIDAKRRAMQCVIRGPAEAPVCAEAIYDSVTRSCIDLHLQNAIQIPGTDKKISIGFVRWNNIGPCRGFARHLLNFEEVSAGFTHRVLCYHSQHFPVVMDLIESRLDLWLSRKPSGKALWEHADIKEIVESTSLDQKDILLIVSATSIEEVGRDHDFDWGVFEPGSARAIVQSAGRIRRHRSGKHGPTNIALMNTTFRGAEKDEDRSFIYPGVEDVRKMRGLDFKLPSRFIDGLLPVSEMSASVDARYSISESESKDFPMPCLEHKRLNTVLFGPADEAVDLNSFASSPVLMLSDFHNKKNRFRDNPGMRNATWFIGSLDEYVNSNGSLGWMKINRKDEVLKSESSVDNEPVSELELSRALIPMTCADLQDTFLSVLHRMYGSDVSGSESQLAFLLGMDINAYQNDEEGICFHPLLGAQKK